MDKVRVFVSSTFKDNSFDREFIKLILGQLSIETQLFPEGSIAGTKDEYLYELSRSHIMMLLVPTTHSPVVEREIECARINGIPIIPFYKVKVSSSTDYFSAPVQRRVRLYGLENSREHACVYNKLSTLQSGVISGISAVLASRMSSTLVLRPWTSDIYEQADGAIIFTGYRLAISQSTSSIILGPRKDRYQELSFYNHCMGFIEDCLSGGKNLQVLHIFNSDNTLLDLRHRITEYPKAKESINRLELNISNLRNNPSVKLIPIESQITPTIIADDRFTVATLFGDNWFYMWLSESHAGANELWEILSSLPVKEDISDFIKKAKALI